jgi:hypothetical protein
MILCVDNHTPYTDQDQDPGLVILPFPQSRGSPSPYFLFLFFFSHLPNRSNHRVDLILVLTWSAARACIMQVPCVRQL